MNKDKKSTVDLDVPGAEFQGEGDYDADRRYREHTEQFLKSANVPDLAKRAAPKSKSEADDLKHAEEVGRSHVAGGGTSDPGADEPSPRS